jgi:hypothetical protein
VVFAAFFADSAELTLASSKASAADSNVSPNIENIFESGDSALVVILSEGSKRYK